LFRYGVSGGLCASLLGAWILWTTCLRESHAALGAGGKPPATRVESFSGVVKLPVKLDSLLQLPADYAANPQKKYPLILFLHGSGERKSTIRDLVKLGPARRAASGNFPFIVFSPHCPPGKWWADADMTLAVMQSLAMVCKNSRVDTNRIYLTGMSMGGIGAWNLAQQFPDTFAALAVVCGSGTPWLVERVATMPIAIFHGARDRKVPVHYAQQMAMSLARVGNTPRLNIFPRQGHAIWRMVYSDPALYEWFARQNLAERLKTTTTATKGPSK
jgi:predicted peptidase